jgi:DNA-binding transcriptional regulator YiaG
MRFRHTVDFRSFQALPEGFVSLDDLMSRDDVRPADELMRQARADLAQKRNVTGLARLRLDAGMSQAELAKKIGTSQPRLSQWERGDEKPSLENLKRLREALGVTYDQIMECF